MERDIEIEKLNNDHNNYATSKSNSQNLINSSLIISLANNMITIIWVNQLDGWSITAISFIALSIFIQITMFILLVVLAKATTEKIGRTCTATKINTWVTILSGLLPIISGIIAILDRLRPMPRAIPVGTNSTLA